jgi:hypothetical protein
VSSPPDQATEQASCDIRASDNQCKRRERKAPKIKVKSHQRKPLQISLEPGETERLMSAFGTIELCHLSGAPGFVSVLVRLYGRVAPG